MNTIKFDSKNTKIVAHRGLSGLEPENTVSAFIAAGNRSYYGIECDVQITKDGKFAVVHNPTLEAVSGVNLEISNSTLDELKAVKLDNICRLERAAVGPDCHKKDRSDLFLPEMKEYIGVCKKYEKVCILELKGLMEPKYIKEIVEEIKELDYLYNVVFISFELDNLIYLRSILPEQPIQYLLCEYSDDVIDILNKYSFDLDIKYKVLTKEIVDKVHENGHIVNCWTCDDKEEGEKLASWGVDQITTNILE